MSEPAFGPNDNETWSKLYEGQRDAIDRDIHPLFGDGLRALCINAERIPDLDEVNHRLRARTGFVGKYVDGHKMPVAFFPMLARREFPVGNFIRDARDLAYTPAPDVFHDLFGHMPYLADHRYAEFSQRFGALAATFSDNPEAMVQFDRLYWFTLEFALIRGEKGPQVFGSGITSSRWETVYALSEKPEVLPFDLDKIRAQPFKIDELQKRLFLLSSLEELYGCLEPFAELIKSE